MWRSLIRFVILIYPLWITTFDDLEAYVSYCIELINVNGFHTDITLIRKIDSYQATIEIFILEIIIFKVLVFINLVRLSLRDNEIKKNL